MTQATQLLDRLDRVKTMGPGRWLARCPAHEDQSPSLSIRETDDGTVLIKCFAGCGALDILSALGLQWSALFPRSPTGPKHRSPSDSRMPARDLLVIISHDVTVIVTVAADMLTGKTISETDWNSLARAAARITEARNHLR